VLVCRARRSCAARLSNSGTTTWYPGVNYPYRLGAQNPLDNLTWGVGRVELGSTVAPGGQVVFGFTVTAPTTPGTYAFGWGMLREDRSQLTKCARFSHADVPERLIRAST
jgi:hypothetical protein